MKTALFFLLSIISLSAFCQDTSERYVIIKIIGGKVLYTDPKNDKKREIKEGDRVETISEKNFKLSSINTKLRFKDMISGGERVLIPQQRKENKDKWNFIVYMFQGDTQTGNTTTKGDSDEYYIYLQSIFAGSGKPNEPNVLGILGEEQAFKINTKEFPLDESRYFFVEYKYKNDTISKKIYHQKDSIMVRKNDLFKVDGKPIEESAATNMKLYYYDKIKKNEVYFCDINLHFETDEAVIKAIKAAQ